MDNKTFKLLASGGHVDFWSALRKKHNYAINTHNKTMNFDRCLTEQSDPSAHMSLPFPLINNPEYNSLICDFYLNTITKNKAYHSERAVQFYGNNYPEMLQLVQNQHPDLLPSEHIDYFITSTNINSFYLSKGAPNIQLDPTILDAFLKTNIAASVVPLEFIRLPYNNCYIDLSQHQDLYFTNSVDYQSRLLGMFCNAATAKPTDKYYSNLVNSPEYQSLVDKGIIIIGEDVSIITVTVCHARSFDKTPHHYTFKLLYSPSSKVDVNVLSLFIDCNYSNNSTVNQLALSKINNYQELDLKLDKNGDIDFQFYKKNGWILSPAQRAVNVLMNTIFYMAFNDNDRETIKNAHDIKITKRTGNPALKTALKKQANHQNSTIRVGKKYRIEHHQPSNNKEQQHKFPPQLRCGHWKKVRTGTMGNYVKKVIWVKPYYTGRTEERKNIKPKLVIVQ